MKAQSMRGDWQMVQRLWRYLGAQPGRFAAALCLYPLNSLCVILPPYLIKTIFDEAIAQHDRHRLVVLSIAYLVVLVLEYVTGFASEYSLSVLGQRAMFALRRDIFAHVQRLPIGFFDRQPLGRTLTRMTTDVEALAEVFSTGAITILSDLLTIVGVVAMMLRIDVHLTAFAFLVVPPLVLVAAFFQRYARQAFGSIRKHIARINAFLAEYLSAMAVVQIFGQQRRTADQFEGLNDDFRRANQQAIFFDAALYAIVEAIGTCAIAALLAYGAFHLEGGALRAGVMVAFIQYIRRFFVPVRDLSTKYTVLQSAFAAAERILGLLDEKPFAPLNQGFRLAAMQQGLELRDVHFAYAAEPTEADFILKGLNLTLHRGERLALVGATGSGKTTVLKLLNRFYDPQRGAVLIDGVDAREVRLHDLRRLFAVVQQDVQLFSGTVLENVAFCERIDVTAARRALRDVGAEAMLARLPRGEDTHVFEQGSNFSAGERQLLALARALALDPEVLVLDEATSNIDSDTEQRIQAALDLLLRDRTAVVVAHRLSTIEKMDRIVVMDGGRILQQGSHAELMQRGGAYRDLVEVQHTAASPPPTARSGSPK